MYQIDEFSRHVTGKALDIQETLDVLIGSCDNYKQKTIFFYHRQKVLEFNLRHINLIINVSLNVSKH